MKTLLVTARTLREEDRWDIDYHLPAAGLSAFPASSLRAVREVATLVKDTRDPTRRPGASFQYVDIASVDVETGSITGAQELTGEEAPSRARKLVRAYDVIVSTCRPTRGAIAIVPEELHGQIASTAFAVLRAREGVNPFYLHHVLRLECTREQLRKWSTGSSYPAILDEDVLKTRIPVLPPAEQDLVAAQVRQALADRQAAIERANAAWARQLAALTARLQGAATEVVAPALEVICTIEQVAARLAALGPVPDEEA